MVTLQSILEIFEQLKNVLCQYDYYIYTSRRIFHLTNSELKIPHLMGLQYIGKSNKYTGDYGVYAIKKKIVTHSFINEKIRKNYETEDKRRIIREIIYRKLKNLHLLEKMFSSYSRIYMYEKTIETAFNCDYLLINESGKIILHLGLVKSINSKGLYHCNSFMATYQSEKQKNIFFSDLKHQYEINKVIRENKITKIKNTIYQSEESEKREMLGIKKMLELNGLNRIDELPLKILKLNQNFGEYHTFDMLTNKNGLLKKCKNNADEKIIEDFFELWKDCM